MLPRDVWVLLPTLYRPEQLRRTLKSLKETAPECGIVVAIEADDRQCEAVAKEFSAITAKCPKPRGGCAYAWNIALKNTPGTAQGFVLAADDVVFVEGWYEAVVASLGLLGGDGLVGFNDIHKQNGTATHFLATRNYLVQHNGGVIACPHYMVEGVDVEAIERARKAGKYIYAQDAKIEHIWNGAKPDKYYQEGLKWIGRSRRQIIERRKTGWPNDYEAVIR